MIGKYEKFGLVAVEGVVCDRSLPECVELADGLFFTSRCPIVPDSQWTEWVGTHFTDRLLSGNLFLVSKGIARTPGIQDAETEYHRQRAFYLYFSLLLGDYFLTLSKPLRVTGENEGGNPEIRSIAEIPRSNVVAGTPPSTIGEDSLIKAAARSQAVGRIYSDPNYWRLKRILRAFLNGMNESYPDARLHQFVRCIEGFILPEIGDTARRMKSRTERFFESAQHELMGIIYDIRCAVEHLHDAVLSSPGEDVMSQRKSLLRYSFVAEGIARFLIDHLLSNESLWRHFVDDGALKKFWGPDGQGEWTAKLDVGALLRRFDERLIPHTVLFSR